MFSNSKGLTKAEAVAYEKILNKISKPTGVKFQTYINIKKQKKGVQ